MSVDTPLQSSLWYRVAELKPRLVARARLHRHRYRGELWYLLQDPASNRVHRFTPAARLVLAAMDGRRSVDDLWRLAQRALGDDAPTQDEMIQLLGQLHGADLLTTDTTPDALELFERGQRQARAKRRRSWINPMAVRIPLWDPGPFLDRLGRWWPRIWGRWSAALWLVVVLPALVWLPQHWPELTHNLSDRVLQADNLLLIGVVFVVIKALHELGHATATHAAGGEVHDMGVMLLVLMPVPYVDASSASVLRSRWSRALIGAAGMVVELFLAALAFYVWLAVEPGLVRALAFNVMLVAGVSTLLFNGNPLLRYDAYYILADIAELPNLAAQSTKYWGYLAQRWLMRVRDAVSPAVTRSERVWFGLYGAASTMYRLLITVAIALFIGTQFFFIGVLLALWAIVMMTIVPIVKAISHMHTRSELRERRGRLALIAAGATAALALFVAIVPLPSRTQAEGVVWLPEQATLRAGTEGFFVRFEIAPGSAVQAGQIVARSVDPALDAELRFLQARVDELQARYAIEFAGDRAQAAIVRDQLRLAQAALDRARERAADLVITAKTDGVLTVVQASDLPGRFHRKGDVLGFIVGDQQPVVRVALEQSAVDMVALTTRACALRLADELSRVIPARIVRQVPAGSTEAPSAALTAAGGGRLALDPRDPQGRRTLERVFQIDVEPQTPLARLPAHGQRVFLRFDMAPEPLAAQLWRPLRRLFLRHFDV